MSPLPETNGHQDQHLDDRPPQNPLIGALAGLSEASLTILKVKIKDSCKDHSCAQMAMAKVVLMHVLHVSLTCSVEECLEKNLVAVDLNQPDLSCQTCRTLTL